MPAHLFAFEMYVCVATQENVRVRIGRVTALVLVVSVRYFLSYHVELQEIPISKLCSCDSRFTHIVTQEFFQGKHSNQYVLVRRLVVSVGLVHQEVYHETSVTFHQKLMRTRNNARGKHGKELRRSRFTNRDASEKLTKGQRKEKKGIWI